MAFSSLCHDRLDDEEAQALQDVENTKTRRLADGLSEAVAESVAKDGRQRVHQDFTERATITDAHTDVRRTGTLSEVVGAVSQKDLRDLTLTYPGLSRRSRECRLVFSRRDGLWARIEADEPVWARQMLAQTLTEAKRNRLFAVERDDGLCTVIVTPWSRRCAA